MDPIIIAIIVILCQYPLAVLTLLKLFRTNEEKSGMIFWDVFVIAVPFIGAASFWIYYAVKGRKKPARAVALPTGQTEENEVTVAEESVSDNPNADISENAETISPAEEPTENIE